jgi:hypothetical protein
MFGRIRASESIMDSGILSKAGDRRIIISDIKGYALVVSDTARNTKLLCIVCIFAEWMPHTA